MICIFSWELRLFDEHFYHLLKLENVLSTFSHSFDVTFELARLRYGFHSSQLSKSSSVDLKSWTSFPRRLLSRVLEVSLLGSSTWNGSPPLKAICL